MNGRRCVMGCRPARTGVFLPLPEDQKGEHLKIDQMVNLWQYAVQEQKQKGVEMNRNEKTERTRARILAAAMEEFGTRGYEGGTVNGICKTGINKGLIYHNFKDKDALYLACLEQSCTRLMDMVTENGRLPDELTYMQIRMRFFTDCPREARIFFEALLQPALPLAGRIREILAPFEKLNEEICRTLIEGLTLRAGISREQALDYFGLMQRMFNGYYSSAACRQESLEARIREHEQNLTRLLDCMLYGIAKQKEEN